MIKLAASLYFPLLAQYVNTIELLINIFKKLKKSSVF